MRMRRNLGGLGLRVKGEGRDQQYLDWVYIAKSGLWGPAVATAPATVGRCRPVRASAAQAGGVGLIGSCGCKLHLEFIFSTGEIQLYLNNVFQKNNLKLIGKMMENILFKP